MTSYISYCQGCEHWPTNDFMMQANVGCAAFPGGIPTEIMQCEVAHNKRMFDQQNDLTYTSIGDEVSDFYFYRLCAQLGEESGNGEK